MNLVIFVINAFIYNQYFFTKVYVQKNMANPPVRKTMVEVPMRENIDALLSKKVCYF